MQLQLPKSKVNFIGDPHFGKKFPDVALHRRGEREAAQIAEFERLLHEDGDVCIMVGDLFDTYLVPNEVLFRVYGAIRMAALAHPEREFLMMEGNHDIARNSETVTSFDILVAMLDESTDNVHFFQETSEFYTNKGDVLLICPYAEFSTAAEEVGKFAGNKYDLAVGHWDTDVIAGPHNLCPFDLLAEMTPLVVTGHVHTSEEKQMLGFTFYRTGSMLPYSHSEDPEGKLYVTRTLEQIAVETAEDPDCYKDKCLRVILIGDEQAPVGLNTLQFSMKRLESLPDEKLEVKMEQFSFKALFDQCFKENEVPDDIRDVYWEIYQQEAIHDSES